MELLFEKFKQSKNKPSQASVQAKKLGLNYLGFGRYGVVNKEKGKFEVTHIDKKGMLIPVDIGHDYDMQKRQHKITVPKTDPKWAQRYGEKFTKAIKKDYKKVDRKYNDEYDTDLGKQLDSMADLASYRKLKVLNKGLKKLFGDDTYKNNSPYAKVISDYVTDSDPINKYLYTGSTSRDYNTRMLEWQVKTLDRLFDKKEVRAPMNYSVFRGASGKLEKGKHYTFKGFMSTSRDPNVADNFSADEKDSVLIKINVKKGQRILDLDNAHPDLSNSDEGEHLLPRNTKLKIIGGPEFLNTGRQVFHAEIVEKE